MKPDRWKALASRMQRGGMPSVFGRKAGLVQWHEFDTNKQAGFFIGIPPNEISMCTSACAMYKLNSHKLRLVPKPAIVHAAVPGCLPAQCIIHDAGADADAGAGAGPSPREPPPAARARASDSEASGGVGEDKRAADNAVDGAAAAAAAPSRGLHRDSYVLSRLAGDSEPGPLQSRLRD